jgi:hypothetical protein
VAEQSQLACTRARSTTSAISVLEINGLPASASVRRAKAAGQSCAKKGRWGSGGSAIAGVIKVAITVVITGAVQQTEKTTVIRPVKRPVKEKSVQLSLIAPPFHMSCLLDVLSAWPVCLAFLTLSFYEALAKLRPYLGRF